MASLSSWFGRNDPSPADVDEEWFDCDVLEMEESEMEEAVQEMVKEEEASSVKTPEPVARIAKTDRASTTKANTNNDKEEVPNKLAAEEKEKAEETKEEPTKGVIYQKGEEVLYTNSTGTWRASIRKVYLDDELVPFYDIWVDGREKQTDNAHLRPVPQKGDPKIRAPPANYNPEQPLEDRNNTAKMVEPTAKELNYFQRLAEGASKKAQKVGGKVLLLRDMLEMHIKGVHALQAWEVAIIASCLVYILNPMDLVLDALPGGFADDVLVLGAAIHRLNATIQKFQQWKADNPKDFEKGKAQPWFHSKTNHNCKVEGTEPTHKGTEQNGNYNGNEAISGLLTRYGMDRSAIRHFDPDHRRRRRDGKNKNEEARAANKSSKIKETSRRRGVDRRRSSTRRNNLLEQRNKNEANNEDEANRSSKIKETSQRRGVERRRSSTSEKISSRRNQNEAAVEEQANKSSKIKETSRRRSFTHRNSPPERTADDGLPTLSSFRSPMSSSASEQRLATKTVLSDASIRRNATDASDRRRLREKEGRRLPDFMPQRVLGDNNKRSSSTGRPTAFETPSDRRRAVLAENRRQRDY